jgi:GTP pyrophosphokinase
LGTAEILHGLGLDHESLCAALLRGVPQYKKDAAAPIEAYGAEIAALLTRINRTDQIEALSGAASLGVQGGSKDAALQLESLRKMLLAMAEDVRVVIIRLAERTYLMRSLNDSAAGGDMQTARQTMDLFAPLANRLGLWHIKWELEDLSFRQLQPERYRLIVQQLDELRELREQFINDVITRLNSTLVEAGIKGQISGRPKHIYSIHKKMQSKGVDLEKLYDIRAVRVLVPQVRDCYTVLGLVHDLWEPVPGEFDDYIAKPKANNYRSLHTAVVVAGKTLEVQIRTHDMHRESELGVAAHWRYKEGSRADKAFDAKIAWLRQVLDWKSELTSSGALSEKLKSGLFDDSVYVLTPQGRVIDLPAGSTPVDFAYHLHTDLGHRCRGAKVDGNIVPLNYRLHNAQTVEIHAAKQGGPSRDWLNPEQGYLHSPRAMAKVRQWFKQQFIEQEIAAGRVTLERELARLSLTGQKLEKLAQLLHFKTVDEMLAAIGRGEITPRQIDMALAPPTLLQPIAEEPIAAPEQARSGASGGVLVLGMNNIATVLAKCCKPVPPDSIVGFVSMARGVTVHRADCVNMIKLDVKQRERQMLASWGNTADAPFSTEIEVLATDRQGLLRDVSEAIAREKVNVTAVNTITKNNQASMRFTVEITKLEHLIRILKMVQEVPGVMSAARR